MTLPLQNQQLETVLRAFELVVQDLLAAGQIPQQQFLGIGVGLAGIIDASRGVLRQSPILGWENIFLADLLRARLGVPVYIDNDVNTLTLTELWFGRGQDVSNFLLVTLGRGLGAGIVIDGKLYQGYAGGAGEFGHFVVDPEGPPCACGKHGCLETYVADPGLVRAARAQHAASSQDIKINNIETLILLAENGDAVARQVLKQAGDLLGRNLANLVNMLVPQLIVISGEGVRSGEWLFGPMRQALGQYVLPSLAGGTELEVDAWDEYAWARGAAGLVLHQIFKSPVRKEALYGEVSER